MINLRASLGSDVVAEAMRRAPEIMDQHAEAGLERAAQEIARTAKLETPKAHSTLADSIQVRRPARFRRVVTPGTNYADFVNEGTGIFGPHHKASGLMPNVRSLQDWIRVARISPRRGNMSERSLAFAIATSIARTGTRKDAFMDRAAEKGHDILEQRVAAELQLGLREVMA